MHSLQRRIISRGNIGQLFENVRVRITMSPCQPYESCQPLHLLLTWYQVMGRLGTYFYAKIAGACPTMQYLVIQVHCVVEKSWSCLGRKWSINSASTTRIVIPESVSIFQEVPCFCFNTARIIPQAVIELGLWSKNSMHAAA